MSSKKVTADLDAFLKEALGNSPTLKMYGKTWTLCPELPASAMLDWKVSEASGDGGLETQINTLTQILSPSSQVEDLLSLGLGPTAIGIFISVAIGIYSGEEPDEVIGRLREAFAAEKEAKDAPEDDGAKKE